jgi:drug/metabolite transporter (DMT)-like permease
MGSLATISQLLMTRAYASSTKAGVVGATGYTTILFSILVGVIIGEGLPNLTTTFGIILIVIAGLMVTKK